MKKALRKGKPKASLNNHDRFVLCGLFLLLGRFGLARSDGLGIDGFWIING